MVGKKICKNSENFISRLLPKEFMGKFETIGDGIFFFEVAEKKFKNYFKKFGIGWFIPHRVVADNANYKPPPLPPPHLIRLNRPFSLKRRCNISSQ